MKLKIEKREDGWWIVEGDEDCGPYKTKREANEDRIGLQRFYDYEYPNLQDD